MGPRHGRQIQPPLWLRPAIQQPSALAANDRRKNTDQRSGQAVPGQRIFEMAVGQDRAVWRRPGAIRPGSRARLRVDEERREALRGRELQRERPPWHGARSRQNQPLPGASFAGVNDAGPARQTHRPVTVDLAGDLPLRRAVEGSLQLHPGTKPRLTSTERQSRASGVINV